MGQVTDRTRGLVLDRDGYRCVAEGQLPGRCMGHLDMGHLLGRGMGGSGEDSPYDLPGWITTQCRHHNHNIEFDGPTTALALTLGLHYPRSSPATLPAQAVVRYPDGRWYVLDNDGGKTPAEQDNPWLQPVSPVPWL